jgi:hypothetical protein
MLDVPDLARRHVPLEDLKDGPGDALREDLGLAGEGRGDVGQEVLPLALPTGFPCGIQPS